MEMNYLSSVKPAGETTDMDTRKLIESQRLQQHNSIVYLYCLLLYKGEMNDLFTQSFYSLLNSLISE